MATYSVTVSGTSWTVSIAGVGQQGAATTITVVATQAAYDAATPGANELVVLYA